MKSKWPCKYFTFHELKCKSTGKGRWGGDFLLELDLLRNEWGSPIIVNSSARSYAYNKAIGGHPRSLHVYDKPYHDTGGTIAVDISMRHEDNKDLFVDLASSRNWSVLIYDNFVHIDRRHTVLGLPKIIKLG